MIEMASPSQSQSPSSQLSAAFNSNWMPSSGSNSLSSLQQRGSMGPSFQMGLQQAHSNQQQQTQQGSPNANAGSRNMFALGQRGILPQLPGQNVGMNQIKRPGMPPSSSILSNTSTSSSMSNLSMTMAMSAFSRNNDNTPSLDLSEFPTLGNRGSGSNPTPRNYDWKQMIWKDASKSQRSQEPAPEFQIQQEDFPALPGAQNPPSGTSLENGRKSPSGASGNNIGPYEQALRDSRQSSGLNQKRGIQLLPDGTVTNIPQGMVTDQFGMAGLLTFIRAAETDPNLVALNPGIDLTTLGLNLSSGENLYSTFQSPWADGPCRPQDIDFHVPSEYLTNLFIREKLAPIRLNRYGDDLLFFLYYMNGNDVLQLAAAAELYNRDWRCHKEERVWITRPQGMEPVVKTQTYERGTYHYFDVQSWRKSSKEFHLEYDKLEEKPQLPNMTAPNQQQQQQAQQQQQQHLGPLHNAHPTPAMSHA